MTRPTIALVLAAGKGTRMKSAVPKVLHTLLGIPLLQHVIDLLDGVGIKRKVIVVGHGGEKVRDSLERLGNHDLSFVEQPVQKGTGHAVMCAEACLSSIEGSILICCGDTPLFTRKTLASFVDSHESRANDLSLLSVRMTDPTGYGRIVRDGEGRFLRIVEEKDASETERSIREVNTGTYLVDSTILFDLLKGVGSDNAQGEYYLTDIVALAVEQGLRVDAFPLAEEEEAIGVNSRAQLALAEAVLLKRIRQRWLDDGVTMSVPETVYIEPDVTLGKDVVIGPNVVIKGRTSIGDNCVVGPFSYLEDATIPSGSVVEPFSKIAQGLEDSTRRERRTKNP